MVPAKTIIDALKRFIPRMEKTGEAFAGHTVLQDPIFRSAIAGTLTTILERMEGQPDEVRCSELVAGLMLTALQYFHMGYEQASLENQGLRGRVQ